MAISSDTPFAREAAIASTSSNNNSSSITEPTTESSSHPPPSKPTNDDQASNTSTATPSKTSSDTAVSSSDTPTHNVDPTIEFAGDVKTNNDIPSQEILNKIQDFTVLDKDGKSLPFRNIYKGPLVARRVLIIFIRHFFCGNCQEYIRTLTQSITPSSLLSLPTPTFIAIMGCGSPSLIPMYASATSCPFPIYADPTARIYSSLGMLRTLNLGIKRPEYQRKGLLSMAVQSVVQGVRELGRGRAFKGGSWRGGDMQQVGGEFLFEPTDWMASPVGSPDTPQLGLGGQKEGYFNGGWRDEEKRVTWCHRMRNTRDHAEIPELREVLGLDVGEGGGNQKRWTRALEERKGTGLSGRTRKSLSPGRSEKVREGRMSAQIVR